MEKGNNPKQIYFTYSLSLYLIGQNIIPYIQLVERKAGEQPASSNDYSVSKKLRFLLMKEKVTEHFRALLAISAMLCLHL